MGGAPHDRGRLRCGGLGVQDDLDARMLDAHARRDRDALVALYGEAAARAAGRHDTDAEAFFLTHAYIFALDRGAVQATDLHARLKTLGREQ